MITLTGRIEHIEKIKDDGICLFEFTTPDGNAKRAKNGKVYARFISCMCYEKATVRVDGYWKDMMFFVLRMTPVYMGEEECVKLLAANAEGIGIKSAKKIVGKYKEDLYKTPRHKLEYMLHNDFPKFSAKKIGNICDVLGVVDETLKKLEEYLLPYGVPYESIFYIFNENRERSLLFLKHDPYGIGGRAGIRFAVLEKIAYDLKIDAYSDIRVRGIVHYVLNLGTNNGHTFMPMDEFYQTVNRISKSYAYKNEIPEIILSNLIYMDNYLYIDEAGITFRYLYSDEVKVTNEISILDKGGELLEVPDEEIKEIEENFEIQYSDTQRKAFPLVTRPGISILTGGPGTGKTTTVRGLIEWYHRKNPNKEIALCAQTGRAAKKLSESTGYPASTICMLIDYRPFSGMQSSSKDKNNPVEADLIIVDESSMIGTHTFGLLLQAIKPGATVVLVGDEDQLPSIEPGNILHDLIASGRFPVCRLAENFRQGENTSIIKNAIRIKEGAVPEKADNFQLIQVKNDTEAFEKIKTILTKRFDREYPFYLQMIEPSYKGAAGVHAINRHMRELLKRDVTRKVSEEDKIIFTRTDYKLGYMNGQFGIIKEFAESGIVVYTDNERVLLPYSAAADIEPAYSFTIHKSQGSENPVILIYLPENPAVMLQRSIIYTAVTRAEKEVVIVYENNALETACKNNSMKQRHTRLMDMLIQKQQNI